MGNFLTAKSFTFFDTETTHLDPSRSAILEIAIITDWEDGKRDVWSTKIKPRDLELEHASDEALKICNYTYEDWEDAPYFEDVAETIAQKLRWGPVIAHNAQFDVNHLTASFKRRGWREPRFNERFEDGKKLFRVGYPVIDTCALAYLFVETERPNLKALREHLEISDEGAHTALKDTEDCATLFYNIISNIKQPV